jgi:hypothetical protein
MNGEEVDRVEWTEEASVKNEGKKRDGQRREESLGPPCDVDKTLW